MNGASSQSGASIHQSGQLPNMAKGIYTKLCKNVVHGQQDNGSQFNFGRSFKLWRHVGH